MAAPWGEALEDLDEEVLAEADAEARVFGVGPAAAVDELVCGLRGQSIGELGWVLTTATEGRPLSGWSTDAVRASRIGRREARTTPFEAVARHHHAHLLICSSARRHRRARRRAGAPSYP
ncbi:hypothetical protein [Streptomyces sp. NPDC006270]|uniref:hypothetical protein n=1 Tax=Streptomyces sp. NPDC006270 TaxID=3364741 RepID=UPI0036A0E53B